MEEVFRTLMEGDFDAVLAVALRAWHFTYHEIYGHDYIEKFVREHYGSGRLSQLMNGIRRGTTFFEVAFEGATVLGFCSAGLQREGVVLNRLYLDPDRLGRGVATKFLKRLEEFVRGHGYKKYHCYVHQGNELGIRFYQKHGFTRKRLQTRANDWYMEKKLSPTPKS